MSTIPPLIDQMAAKQTTFNHDPKHWITMLDTLSNDMHVTYTDFDLLSENLYTLYKSICDRCAQFFDDLRQRMLNGTFKLSTLPVYSIDDCLPSPNDEDLNLDFGQLIEKHIGKFDQSEPIAITALLGKLIEIMQALMASDQALLEILIFPFAVDDMTPGKLASYQKKLTLFLGKRHYIPIGGKCLKR